MSGALIVRGDALRLPLADASVDLVVTSPPYLWKRSYAISGAGELGNEPDWRAYLANLYAVTDELLRVLKPSGSIFVNLGDTRVTGTEAKWLGVPVKSRLLLPERYRVGCQDRYAARGVIVRQVQIWWKRNGLPESATDRTRDEHEDWVHLARRPDYYAAIDELREPQATIGERHGIKTGGKNGHPTWHDTPARQLDPLGKLPGSVWSIPSEPLQVPAYLGVDHYAAFPSEWPRRLILGWSPPGICVACGQGRWPVVERRVPEDAHRYRPGKEHGSAQPPRRFNNTSEDTSATILGYACACTPSTLHPGTGEPSGPSHAAAIAAGRYPNDGAGWPRGDSGHAGLGDRPKVGPWREWHLDGWRAPPTRPAVVLDPFAGTCTTVMVARALDRIGIGVDLSAAYCRLAAWRVWHSGHAAKATSRTNRERQGQLTYD